MGILKKFFYGIAQGAGLTIGAGAAVISAMYLFFNREQIGKAINEIFSNVHSEIN